MLRELRRTTDHVMYGAWAAMRRRCDWPNADSYASYGGRGIKVCERWKSFRNFLEDMGERPTPAHTIERIDNNGNYEPGNCRWATRMEQGQNTRRCRYVTIDGITASLGAHARRLGIDRSTVGRRHPDLRAKSISDNKSLDDAYLLAGHIDIKMTRRTYDRNRRRVEPLR